MAARWFTILRIIALWLFAFALTSIVILLWHEVLMVFAVNTLHWNKYIIPLVHILYYFITGLVWVAFFILHLEYLNRSARKGKLLEAAFVTLGAQLLLIALGQACLTLYGFLPAGALGLALMAGEGLAGAGMLALARYRRTRPKDVQTAGQS